MFKLIYSIAFGLFSQFLNAHINGMAAGCSGEVDFPLANLVGLLMIFSVGFVYWIIYHMIDSAKYYKAIHVWLGALGLFFLNLLIAFLFVFNDIQNNNFCSMNPIVWQDALGFGVLNGCWALICFAILTSLPYPRKFSKNLSNTTLWKP